jgi:outer membrane protein assembly factor BamE (lipoprotein component of BamABCDE complex)
MVDDLLRRHSFRGMTREQVTAIVGEPDKTEYFKEWDLVYWLGPERGFMSIDSEWLVFRLDSQKKVTDLRNVRD